MGKVFKYRYGLYAKPHSHMKLIKMCKSNSIEDAFKHFVNFYKSIGVDVNTMKTFVVVPYVGVEQNSPDFDNANGWDFCGEIKTFYPESK